MSKSASGSKVKTIDLRDKEWNDQFSNLSKMLDQYLVSASNSTNIPSGAQTNLQPANQHNNIGYSYRASPNTKPTTAVTTSTNTTSFSQHYSAGATNSNPYSIPNPYKQSKTQYTTSSPQQKNTIIATTVQPQSYTSVPKPQTQPEHPSGKKPSIGSSLSPQRSKDSLGFVVLYLTF